MPPGISEANGDSGRSEEGNEDVDERRSFQMQKHIDLLSAYGKDERSFDYAMSEYLRMSGLYWVTTALRLLNAHHRGPSPDDTMRYLRTCYSARDGGFAPCPRHDSHLLYTLSAVQVACILGRETELAAGEIAKYVASLQREDGSFMGDQWGETDARLSFCAVATLSLLGRLDAIDVTKATAYVLSCHNVDGGFGSRPNSESHAGMIYCCVGFLRITGQLDAIDADQLGWWLCERQRPCGGFNGRPEKLEDVCYSWWVLASLCMIRRCHWIGRADLVRFILSCQDVESGGFSDRPGNVADPFHTLFGVAALSLLRYDEDTIGRVDPCYCMPTSVLDRLDLRASSAT